MEKKYYSGWGVALGIVTQDMKDGNNNCCCLFATDNKFPAKNSVPAVVTSFRRNIVSAEGRITLVEFACSLQCMFFKVASNFHYDFLKLVRKFLCENISLSYPTCVTASSDRALNTFLEVEEPAEMGVSLGTGVHRHRSISHPGVKYVPRQWVLRRILSNRS